MLEPQYFNPGVYVVKREDGQIERYLNNKLHCLIGPAIETACGTKMWYANGLLHRLDGPAIVWANGEKEWWINDKWLSVHPLHKWLLDRNLLKAFKKSKLTQKQLLEIKFIFGLP